MKRLALTVGLIGIGCCLNAENLMWIGGGDDGTPARWDLNPENLVWENAAKEAVCWSNGATAVFHKADSLLSLEVGEGVSISGITLYSPLSLSGASPTLTGGTINPHAANLAFLSGLDATNGIKIIGGQIGFHEFLNGTEAKTVFKDFEISELSGLQAVIDGGWVKRAPANVSHWQFDPQTQTITVQLQCFDDSYVKGVKVELKQQGSDITAKVLWAKNYRTPDPQMVGIDLEKHGSAGMGNIAINTWSAGYGVAEIYIQPKDGVLPGITLDGDCAIGRQIEIGRDTVLCFENGLSVNKNLLNIPILNDGKLLVRTGTGHLMTGKMTGKGGFEIDLPRQEETVLSAYTGYVGNSANPTRFPNRTVEEIASAVGNIGGLVGNNLKSYETRAYHLAYNPDERVAAIQMQFAEIPEDPKYGAYLKCVKIKFRQDQNDVIAEPVYSRFRNIGDRANPPWGINFDRNYTGEFPPVTEDGDRQGYGIRDFGLIFGPGWKMSAAEENSYQGGTIIQSGRLTVHSRNSLPGSQETKIQIAPEGELYLLSNNNGGAGAPGRIGPTDPMRIQGKLVIKYDWTMGEGKTLIVDGGKIDIQTGTKDSSYQYMNQLELSNGAEIMGNPIHVGFYKELKNPPSHTRVTGTMVCTNSAGLRLIRDDKKKESIPDSQFYEFLIDDVTSSPEADFVISGPIIDTFTSDELSTGLRLVKKGTGTLLWTAENTTTSQIDIVEGTLALKHSKNLHSNPITLFNGGLELQAENLQAGTLAVAEGEAPAWIDLGETGKEGSISFLKSDGIPWTGTLEIRGNLQPGRLRFGSDSQGLQPPQLDKIRCVNDQYATPQRVTLNAEGWLTLTPKGTILLLQ